MSEAEVIDTGIGIIIGIEIILPVANISILFWEIMFI